MNVKDVYSDRSTIELSRDELLILNSALNEVCNGIELFEFDTRMGASHEKVTKLLRDVGRALDAVEAASEL